MKTLLVIAPHPELSDAIRAALSAEQYRVIHRRDVTEAEPLLGQGLLDVCVVGAEENDVQSLWAVEKIRRRLPHCPLLVYTGVTPWEWEEEAYLHGVAHVLPKPPRARALNALLERLPAPAAVTPVRPPALRALIPRPLESAKSVSGLHNPVRALEVLRDFSGILTHSLCAEAMLKQFLLLLREIIGVNRAAIFLRPPPVAFGGSAASTEGRRFRSACAIGLSPGLLEHFELSPEAGIGGYLFRQGRILRRDSDEALVDPEMQKEFELLGAQVAIPILDRETLVGVAAFDGRVTGEPLTNEELELIFHLLEELGLAVKNIWLHDQLASNHEMMADILRQLSSACVVVSRDLTVLHANKTARKYFGRGGGRSGELEFSDLPQLLGGKIYQVLKTGTGIATFKHEPADAPGTVFHVTIVPFQRQDSPLPNSVLLIAEDHTQTEQLQKLEIEAANLRLVRSMADRMAHEIGNAMVSISTHQQLLADQYKDPEFRASLDVALADGVKRVTRLVNQMRFLARDGMGMKESFPLAPLIEEAHQEAQKLYPAKHAKLKCEDGQHPVILAGDRPALKQALTEVMLNALQASPSDAKIGVRILADTHSDGERWVHIDVEDNGKGFTPETVQKVPEPFFTTRNVGLGLGLTVTRKIVETHKGKLSIGTPGKTGVVRISLPIDSPVGS